MIQNGSAKIMLMLSRVAVGWMMFYAGITKVMDPAWTSAGYLKVAKTFPSFFQSLTAPGVIPVVDFVNEWALTLLGISLIFGIAVRLSSVLGAVLMLLYYFPLLAFPYPNAHAYIVDEHIIYISILLFFAAVRAGRYYGLDPRFGSRLG